MCFTVILSKHCVFDLIICTQYLFFISPIFFVFPLFLSLLCFFRIYFFLSKFTNYVIYALFGVQDPVTIIICCMHSSECKHVPTTKMFLEILTFVSAIECRFCFIIHRSSKFEVSFLKITVTVTVYSSPNFKASEGRRAGWWNSMVYLLTSSVPHMQEFPLQWRHNGRDSVTNYEITIVYSTVYSDAA